MLLGTGMLSARQQCVLQSLKATIRALPCCKRLIATLEKFSLLLRGRVIRTSTGDPVIDKTKRNVNKDTVRNMLEKVVPMGRRNAVGDGARDKYYHIVETLESAIGALQSSHMILRLVIGAVRKYQRSMSWVVKPGRKNTYLT
ncbi:hypothetical protein BDR07DRAFT_20910 [Suillus spraguei]|nr:hypothetical protein BDR07DRAFT_20910 [Suillus spraguei]